MTPRILDQSTKLKDVLYEIRGPVLARANRISEQLNVAVSVVHHANAGGAKPRPHSPDPFPAPARKGVSKP